MSMSYRALVLLAALSVPGCFGPTEVDTGPDARLLFLVQRTPATSVMEALFQGRVEVDQQGCFRLDSEPERPTVVWPFGFRLASDQASLVVLDATGDEVARVGALLRMSGGIVPALPSDEILTPESQAAARARCPGAYWIVGDMLDTAPR